MDLHICRICGGIEDLKIILDNDFEMVEKLSKCANIHIDSTDSLPKLICGQCVNNLEISYRLRKQSEETQKLLRQKIEMNRNQHFWNDELELSAVSVRVYDNAVSTHVKNEKKTKESFVTLNDENKSRKSVVEEGIVSGPIIRISPENEVNRDEILPVPKIESDAENQDDYSDELFIEAEEHKIDTKQSENISTEECTIELLSSPYRSKRSDLGDDYKIKHEYSYTCNTCHNIFSSKKQYTTHIKEHGKERYQCIQCCKFFPTKYRLKRHEDVHADDINHKCPHCERHYRVLHNLRRHIRSVHLNGKSFDCGVCSVSFARKDVLNRHMLLHSDRKNYFCPLCSESFKTRDYLNAHYKSQHEKSAKKYKSNKRIKSNDSKKHQCGYCGKLFKSLFPYKNHILIHTNEKPYECETCGKKFRTIAAVTTHQRIHDDYRPYQCDICLKSFKQNSHLKEHKLLHLENLPQYFCSVCQSSFTKRSNLKAHMQVHATEKPFKCAECTAEFTYMHLLLQHANKVHNRTISKEYAAISDTVDLVKSDENSDSYNETFDCNEIHFINTVSEESEIEEYPSQDQTTSLELEVQSKNNPENQEMSKDVNHEHFIDFIHIDS